MSQHDDAHETILGGVLVGDVSIDDRSVTDLLKSCSTCRERLGEMQSLTERLDVAGSFERTEQTYAAAISDAPGLPAVREIVHERLARSARRPRSGRRPRWVAALAATAAVLLIAWFGTTLSQRKESGSGSGGSGAEIPLGGRPAIEAIAPLGDDASFTTFRFQYSSLPKGGTFEVHVFDGRGEGAVQELDRSGEIAEPVWRPKLEDSTQWPDEIRWEVVALDPQGVEIARSEPQVARRSSQR